LIGVRQKDNVKGLELEPFHAGRSKGKDSFQVFHDVPILLNELQ
jgi:hypothetical protein